MKFKAIVATLIITSTFSDSGIIAAESSEQNYSCSIIKPLVLNVRADTNKSESCLNDNDISQCISDKINDYYSSANSCLRAIDIFVPGTSTEDGTYNHFNYMFSQENNRAHISIKYENGTKWDAALYDKSVINGVEATKAVLNAIKDKIDDEVEEVRIFGHSKGAHIISHLSKLFKESDQFKFWAFAQPGRTAVDITNSDSHDYTGPLGDPGYIHKHNNNLVTINWLNDEVKLYTGKNHNGAMVPQAWEYPGYINDRRTRRGNMVDFRIDHHDTYGGDSELVSLDKLKTDARYKATGDDSAFGPSLKKQYKPYFWGDETCRELAWEAMDSDSFKHEIATSGPRGEECKPRSKQTVRFKMRYLMQRNNTKNDIDFRVAFDTYNEDGAGEEFLTINVPRAQKSQRKWQDLEKTIQLPDSFNLRIQPLDPDGNTKADNTIHIAYIRISGIKDPTSKRPANLTSQYIIGPMSGPIIGAFEGQDHQKSLAGAIKSGWKKHPDDKSNWKIYKSRERAKLPTNDKKTYETLKFKGNGNDGQEGFYKPVSLVD